MTSSKNMPTNVPEDCPHDVVDNRGSSTTVQRTFCKLCCTFVDERPQSFAKDAKRTAEVVRRASIDQINAINNVITEVEVTADQTIKILKEFP